MFSHNDIFGILILANKTKKLNLEKRKRKRKASKIQLSERVDLSLSFIYQLKIFKIKTHRQRYVMFYVSLGAP